MKKQILTMGLAVMASVASAASPAFTTAAERVDSLMRCLFHDGEPGAAVVVAKNDDVIVDCGYGVADIVTGDRIDGTRCLTLRRFQSSLRWLACCRLPTAGCCVPTMRWLISCLMKVASGVKSGCRI